MPATVAVRAANVRDKARVVAMTDTRTVVAHLVTDEAVAAGRRAGRYVGVCDAVVVAGSLLEGTGRGCRSCQDWAVAQ
ncbi:MAG: hypothetical protein ACRDTE_02120 [Pseudonocardiaceae bacterium]